MGEEVKLLGALQVLFDRAQLAFSSMDVSWEIRIFPDSAIELRVVVPSFNREVAASSRRIYTGRIHISRLWHARSDPEALFGRECEFVIRDIKRAMEDGS